MADEAFVNPPGYNPNTNSYPSFDSAGVLSFGTLNSGDTAWMLTSTALVLLMTMPGLAIYYSGMVRDKNVLACKSSTQLGIQMSVTRG